jgi:hypothetical protein
MAHGAFETLGTNHRLTQCHISVQLNHHVNSCCMKVTLIPLLYIIFQNCYHLCHMIKHTLHVFYVYIVFSVLLHKGKYMKLLMIVPWKVKEEWWYSSTFRNLSITWRSGVSFVSSLLCTHWKGSWNLLNGMQCSPQNWSGCYGEEKISCPCCESNNDPDCSPVTIQSDLFQFPFPSV